MVVANLSDPAARNRDFTATSTLLLDIGDMYHIFSHIHRIRHAVHRQELSVARAQFVRHYCNRHSFTQTDIYASTALTTDDTNALLNRMSQSEYSDVLVSYFDHASGQTASTSALVRWGQCVFWDDLLTYQPDENSSTSDNDSPVGIDAFPSWNLTGIALFALHILQATTELPQVYNRAQLVAVLQPYVLLLLRDKKLANPEGLQLATLVLARSSQGQQGIALFLQLSLCSTISFRRVELSILRKFGPYSQLFVTFQRPMCQYSCHFWLSRPVLPPTII